MRHLLHRDACDSGPVAAEPPTRVARGASAGTSARDAPSLRELRHPVAESRRRGLPALGFALELPVALGWAAAAGPTIGTATERGPGGAILGELELAIAPAALVMDRDGVLADAAHAAIARAAGGGATRDLAIRAIAIGAAAGAVASLVRLGRPALPYVAVYALASDDMIAGALLVIARHAAPEWPTADAALASLRLASKDTLLARVAR